MSNARGMPGGGMLKLRFDRYISRARLRGQDFATGRNFSFNQCHIYKEFCVFSREINFIKAIEHFFPLFA